MLQLHRWLPLSALLAMWLVGCAKPEPELDPELQRELDAAAATEPQGALQALLESKKQLVLEVVTAMTPETLSEQARQGQQLFASYCADCHPRRGRGDYLKRIPATLLARRSEAELVVWIRGVDQHRSMPNFVDLDPGQLEALAAFLAAEVTR